MMAGTVHGELLRAHASELEEVAAGLGVTVEAGRLHLVARGLRFMAGRIDAREIDMVAPRCADRLEGMDR